MLFALGQHQAPVHAQARLSGNEKLCAFLDDIHITSSPDRATEAHTIVGEELLRKHPWQNQSVESCVEPENIDQNGTSCLERGP